MDDEMLATSAGDRPTFPFHRFEGTHREVGRSFGDACRDLIGEHLRLALERLHERSHLARSDLTDTALRYRPHVVRHAPYLDQEIQGLAEGADISLAEAYFLQLRAELEAPRADECTTFAALPEATGTGRSMVAQNADLPAFYQQLGVVVHFKPQGSPEVLMLTPAGQVSYVGINGHGLGIVANFLVCDGWRVGFPRYLLSRVALQEKSTRDALAAVMAVSRASSRNLIMADADTALDFENTPTRHAVLDPHDGFLAHANHYVSDELLEEERAAPKDLENSRARLGRMERLLDEHRGSLDVTAAQTILRDRENLPHALCRVLGDGPSEDVITFASLIAEPTARRMWVAAGPPCQSEYVSYELDSR